MENSIFVIQKDVVSDQIDKNGQPLVELKNREVLYREGYAYVGALNKRTALKHYHNGKNGSVPQVNDPLTLKMF